MKLVSTGSQTTSPLANQVQGGYREAKSRLSPSAPISVAARNLSHAIAQLMNDQERYSQGDVKRGIKKSLVFLIAFVTLIVLGFYILSRAVLFGAFYVLLPIACNWIDCSSL